MRFNNIIMEDNRTNDIKEDDICKHKIKYKTCRECYYDVEEIQMAEQISNKRVLNKTNSEEEESKKIKL